MSFHLWATSMLIGHDDSVSDISWYENDGVCNTVSMTHPMGSPVKDFDGVPQRGVWQVAERLHMDHQAIIGHLVSNGEFESTIVLYRNHLALLSSLK